MVGDHRRAVTISRKPHRLHFADGDGGVALLLPLDHGHTLGFGGRELAGPVNHEFVGDVLSPFGRVVGDDGFLDRLERGDDVLLGPGAHAIGQSLAGILALIGLCFRGGHCGDGGGRIGGGDRNLLHRQRPPGALLPRPNAEEKNFGIVRRLAMPGDHGEEPVVA